MGGRLAAIVVEYRSGDALSRCLESLEANGVEEVVVVDNGARGESRPPTRVRSELSTRAVWRQVPSRVGVHRGLRWLEAPSNLGFGGGVNLGAAAVPDAELLLVCNPDVVLSHGAVQLLVDALDASPKAALVGPALFDEEGRAVQSARAFPTIRRSWQQAFLGVLHSSGRRSREYRERNWELASSGRVDWVTGACFLVRADVFRSVGGFDPAYFLYAEEVDLCWRLRAAGWEVLYDPRARATHSGAASTSAHPFRAVLEHHRALWRFVRRTSEGPDQLLLPVVAAGLVARAAIASASLALRSGRGDRKPWRPRPRDADTGS